jgi:hypothetical protein
MAGVEGSAVGSLATVPSWGELFPNERLELLRRVAAAAAAAAKRPWGPTQTHGLGDTV